METLRLKPRQPVEDEVENWDDDDFMIESEDLTFRSASTSTNALTNRRDSHSSHFSIRSELESIHGEEEKQVHLPGDDEKSTLDAIAAAANAGIPIPQNVPSSALMGGTIKRLGGRKIKKIIQEDWGDDLELPGPEQALRIKPQDSSKFPEVLRQVSSTQPSPAKPTKVLTTPTQSEEKETKPKVLATPINLDRFRDTEDDDDFFGDGAATIKVSKTRQAPKPISLITPPTPQKKDGDEDFEQDLELPSDGKLKLTNRKDIPKTPSLNTLDDFDWGEGSLGTRFGGTRRDGRSNRSSSISALSPSVSSSITAESEGEDEALDGLVLPDGPLNFGERLQRRRKSRSPERSTDQRPAEPQPQVAKRTPKSDPDRDDFFTGLDIGDGAVFDSGKLTLHRNIKLKETRPASPARPKAAVSLTFTNKPVTTTSRLPLICLKLANSNNNVLTSSVSAALYAAEERDWPEDIQRITPHFGDGHELDGFDDLPTSAHTESKFVKQPIASGNKTQLRNKIYQNILPERTTTPSPLTPYSPAKVDYLPHFARDTTASRIARETSLAQRVPSTGPLAPLTAQRVAQLSTRSNLNPHLPQSTIRSKKTSRKPPQLKPHLIANLTGGKESKMVNGMFYNPDTFRWEGNENALSAFDAPASSPSTASMPPFMFREKENATPRPALITNISSTKGVQVVGGMVFDPQNMCWLKIGPQTTKTEINDPMDGFNAIDDDEDVFKDIPDLEDNTAASTESGGHGRVSDIKDDWLVGEEFDVGPEFVRRQREEEERWRKKCEKWLGVQRNQEAWRWAIRDIVRETAGRR
ncbi:putative cytokinesis regulator protein [Phaeoacremonium minimum UCRPA7]|uniref:Putative cytokinesis regulator protein n=1 Tax=Phaeoacremonium minimum (strain UCR-PA7) TaxID=1286976 RepID=R8BY98_PHAM7|nr:putative cytokinesis regulator protein [Phaeoacremonium minimum UCRPA7]EOO04315.1 putative cytokinesis regulator protein [Phaeoacremonium minimum UCRPA7]